MKNMITIIVLMCSTFSLPAAEGSMHDFYVLPLPSSSAAEGSAHDPSSSGDIVSRPFRAIERYKTLWHPTRGWYRDKAPLQPFVYLASEKIPYYFRSEQDLIRACKTVAICEKTLLGLKTDLLIFRDIFNNVFDDATKERIRPDFEDMMLHRDKLLVSTKNPAPTLFQDWENLLYDILKIRNQFSAIYSRLCSREQSNNRLLQFYAIRFPIMGKELDTVCLPTRSLFEMKKHEQRIVLYMIDMSTRVKIFKNHIRDMYQELVHYARVLPRELEEDPTLAARCASQYEATLQSLGSQPLRERGDDTMPLDERWYKLFEFFVRDMEDLLDFYADEDLVKD
jgi:hypothetical protein